MDFDNASWYIRKTRDDNEFSSTRLLLGQTDHKLIQKLWLKYMSLYAYLLLKWQWCLKCKIFSILLYHLIHLLLWKKEIWNSINQYLIIFTTVIIDWFLGSLLIWQTTIWISKKKLQLTGIINNNELSL